jgi:hypothetical protein
VYVSEHAVSSENVTFEENVIIILESLCILCFGLRVKVNYVESCT